MKEVKIKKCLNCGDAVKGRSDKKFCCNDCRTAYNNKLNRDANLFMNNINRILRKNRRILEGFNPKGKSKVTREKLLTAGFNFGYFTNEYVTKSGNVYRFIYDQGYIRLEDQYYALVKKQEYVS